ncbi:MAG: hypothetical protein IPP97_11625 [Candidatus Obscuribacter sp.]|nr:hypothetical protein [Candidatus Obscuribacter sp.]
MSESNLKEPSTPPGSALPPPSRREPHKGPPKALVAIVVLAVLGAIGWFFVWPKFAPSLLTLMNSLSVGAFKAMRPMSVPKSVGEWTL